MRRIRGLVVWGAILLLAWASLGALLPARGGGPTYVHTTASGDWTLEGSPYIVLEPTEVPAGQELHIFAGVEVRFNPFAHLLVDGRLWVLGTEGAPVSFTSNKTVPAPGDWGGILLAGTLEHLVGGAVVEYAETGLALDGGASAHVKDIAIRHCQTKGLDASIATLTAEWVDVQDCQIGVHAMESTVVLRDSFIHGNAQAGLFAVASDMEATGTTFLANGAGAILQLTTLWLKGSAVDEFGVALSLSGASHVTAVSSPISGELQFLDFESAVEVYWSLTVRVEDLYGTVLPGAQVHIWDNANGTQEALLWTGAEGTTDAVLLLSRVWNLEGGVDYSPFIVEATHGEMPAEVPAVLSKDLELRVILAVDKTPPVAVLPASTLVTDEDRAVVLDGTQSHDSDPAFPQGAVFLWSFDDGGPVLLHGAWVTYTFETPGEFLVTLSVTDAGGNDDSDVLMVIVQDTTPPRAEAGEDVAVLAGEEVGLDASGSTDNDPAFPRGARYRWTFMDGEEVRLYGVTPGYTFTRPGRYVISLTVEDAAGNAALDQVVVTVTAEEEFPWVPAAIGAGVALLAVAAVSSTEAGKFGLLKLLFVPLYVKLRRKDILDHFHRGAIYGYIVVHPGDSYTDIKNNLELKNGTLTYHLDVLLREGLIKSRTSGASKLFYPASSRMPEDGVALHGVQKMILERVEESPGISAADLASLVGVSRQLVNYHARSLAAQNLVRVERHGVRNRYYPASGREGRPTR